MPIEPVFSRAGSQCAATITQVLRFESAMFLSGGDYRVNPIVREIVCETIGPTWEIHWTRLKNHRIRVGVPWDPTYGSIKWRKLGAARNNPSIRRATRDACAHHHHPKSRPLRQNEWLCASVTRHSHRPCSPPGSPGPDAPMRKYC